MDKYTDEELYKLKDTEKKEIAYLDDNYKLRFSLTVLKHREFWFSLGFGRTGDLNLSGNCLRWSNAFSFNNPSFDFMLEVLNYHETISEKDLFIILDHLKSNQNKLFFCKEDENSKFTFKNKQLPDKVLNWHYYPTEQYYISKEVLYTPSKLELLDLKKEYPEFCIIYEHFKHLNQIGY